MKYRTENKTIIEKLGREKSIFFNATGTAYFVWNGRRVRLDDVMRLSYPLFFEDEDGYKRFCCGYIGVTNCYGVLVELVNDDTSIQLYTEKEEL